MQTQTPAIPFKIDRVGNRTGFRQRRQLQQRDPLPGKRALHRPQYPPQPQRFDRPEPVFANIEQIVVPVGLVRKAEFQQPQMRRGCFQIFAAFESGGPLRFRGRIDLQPGRAGGFRHGGGRQFGLPFHRDCGGPGGHREMIAGGSKLQPGVQRRSAGTGQRRGERLPPRIGNSGGDIRRNQQLPAVQPDRQRRKPLREHQPAPFEPAVADRDDSGFIDRKTALRHDSPRNGR